MTSLVAPLAIGMLLYVWQSANYYFGLKRVGLTLAFLGYSIGNLGLLIDAYEMNHD